MTDTIIAPATARALLLSIARGEADWREIRRFGVKAAFDQHPMAWEEPAGLPVLSLQARDLAIGFRSYAETPRMLREWARVIELCGCFDLQTLAGDADGDVLLESLWSASFGEPLDRQRLRAIERIASNVTGKNVAP